MFINNGKHYVIHLNMRKDSDSKDQLRAYYFARILDSKLQVLFKSQEQSVSYHSVQECIREAEWEYSNVDMQGFFKQLEEKEWDLRYVYLDKKKNRYTSTLEQVEEVKNEWLRFSMKFMAHVIA